jgi:flagellar basal-body rod protein FlgB
MRTFLDNYLGVHPQALTLEAKRNDLLASNLANVDTPNYKARDIDFKAALSAASVNSNSSGGNGASTSGSAGFITGTAAPLTLRTGNASAATPPASASGSEGATLDPASLKYRVPMAPALDGNTVDEQLEQAAFAENGVRYQASLTFLNTALRNLMTAIVGQ